MIKRILLINDHSHFGGGGDAVLNAELNFLLEEGYDVYRLAFDIENSVKSSARLFSYSESSSKLYRKAHKFLGSINVKKFITEKLREIDPHLVHVHLVSKYPLDVYSSLKGYRVIQTLHGPNLFCATSWGGFKNGASCELAIGGKCYLNGCTSLSNTLLYSQLSKRYLPHLKENIDLFHAPSRQMYSSCKRLGFENSIYQPLGIDKIFEAPIIKPKNSNPILLFVGSLSEVKGVKVLLNSMKEIVARFPNVKLKIAGRGQLKNWIEEFVRNNGLTNNVELLGFVPHEGIRKLYIEADIFLMPSVWQEQFGLVGPEALACETPCIASNVGGIPEWLHHNQWGYLVPPLSSSDLSCATIKLLENAEIRKSFGKAGREFVLQEYSFKQYKNGILKLIKEVMSK